jgi:hypothetical protein
MRLKGINRQGWIANSEGNGMPEIMIFKAGKYAQGDWCKERIQRMVDAYDPDKNIEAPVVIGHRSWSDNEKSELAHGWVKSLRMDGAGKVYADIPGFSPEARHAIADKQLRYVSAEIYEFDKRDAAEAPYLRAAALLGRSTPAVQGTRIPAMFEELVKGGTVTSLQNEDEELIAVFTRKVTAEDFRSVEEPKKNKKEEPSMDEEKLKAALAAKEAEAAMFKKELDELKTAGRKREAEGCFGKLRDEGKLTPALFERAVALDIRLDDGARKDLRSLFSELETKVDLSGAHVADKQKAAPAGDTVTAKVRAFQKEKGIATFAEAAEALYAAQPGLFEEGGSA